MTWLAASISMNLSFQSKKDRDIKYQMSLNVYGSCYQISIAN